MSVQQGSTMAYAHVYYNDQKEDLLCQKKMLEMFCVSNGWSFEIITVFSTRLYGSRSHKNKNQINNL